MRSFLALLRRDLLLAMRQGVDALVVILFFLLGGVMFAFVLGPRPELLAGLAPGVVLVMAALAALLALDRMFQSDFEDGSLDQLALSPLPLELAALAKVLKIEPTYGQRVADDLAKRGVSPNIVRKIVEGLVKAGLQVPAG